MGPSHKPPGFQRARLKKRLTNYYRERKRGHKMKHPSKRRSVQLMVRFTPGEARHVREIVRANSGTVSDFIRVCVTGALAREGDPIAAEMLGAIFEKGLQKAITRRVKQALRDEKAKT